MTKVELIAAVAADAGLTKKDAEKAVNSVVNAITEALKQGERVALVGFGTFETKTRGERKGINPITTLAVLALVYLIQVARYKRKYGDVREKRHP